VNQNVTLKDIASKMNVSRTTVHRALHGKEGVADDLRLNICDRAEKMGYVTNYIASSLRRKTMTLAILLPYKDGFGRFYHKYFWNAVDEFIPEATSLNCIIECHYFSDKDNSQLDTLQSLLDSEKPIDGLLTVIIENNDALSRVIEKFHYRGIPVALLDHDLPETNRLCCVTSQGRLLGRLGAEFLTSITEKSGKVLIAGGSSESISHQQNLTGFKEYVAEKGRDFDAIVIHEYGNYEKLYSKASHLLETHKDIIAFYSITARDTIPLCRAVCDKGLAGILKGVGSDLNPETASLLKDDVVQALIDKNPLDKGRLGLRILFDYVVKGIVPSKRNVTVPIGVIMKNNLPFFEESRY
jgi:LacI family transcriptional regulator